MYNELIETNNERKETKMYAELNYVELMTAYDDAIEAGNDEAEDAISAEFQRRSAELPDGEDE